MGANMKFVLLLPVSGAAGWAAADSRAYHPGRLWRSPGRGREAKSSTCDRSVKQAYAADVTPICLVARILVERSSIAVAARDADWVLCATYRVARCPCAGLALEEPEGEPWRKTKPSRPN